MQLIGSPASPFVRKVRAVLVYKQIPCDFIVDAPSQPGSRVSQFNPLGKIPVLVADDGQAIYDSTVIAEYLDTLAPHPPLLPPVGMARVAVKRWEALASGLLDAAVAIVTERRRDPAEQSPAWIQKQQGKVDNALAALSAGLGDKAWCHGHSATLADIATGIALGYLEFRFPEIAWRTRHANLARLQDTLAAWPAFVETAPPPA